MTRLKSFFKIDAFLMLYQTEWLKKKRNRYENDAQKSIIFLQNSIIFVRQ